MRACLLWALLFFTLASPSFGRHFPQYPWPCEKVENYTSPPVFVLHVFTWNSTLVAPGVATPNLNGPQATTSLKFGVEDALNKPELAGYEVLPNTRIVYNVFDEMLYPPLDVGTMLGLRNLLNATLIVGNPLSDTSYFTGMVGGVTGVAQFSGSASATILSNKYYFPYYTRLCTPFDVQAQVMADVLLHNYEQFGRGWETIAVLLTSDTYGLGIFKEFTAILSPKIKMKTAQSILSDQTNYDLEFEQIKQSGARVIVGFLFTQWDDMALAAKDAGLISPDYVWFGTDTLVGLPWQYNSNGTLRPDVSEAMRGFQATFMTVERTGPKWDSYINTWNNFPPGTVPGVGLPYTPPDYSVIYYDVGFFTALVIDTIDKMGCLHNRHPIHPELWTEVARNLTFVGASGNISINSIGDRVSPYTMWNYRPETNDWSPVGIWSGIGNYTETAPIYYQDNSTTPPDLDIRPPFSYWSCHDREKGYDPTGKAITIKKPGEDDVDYIDSTYICDGFIDCQNFSEESYDGCSTNYEAVFIAFGIVTGLLILMAIGFIIFVFIFGCCVPRKRVRAASPIFLLLVCLSGILGYLSTYAWYGKPHFVACNFQSWLLGLAVTCLLAALCSKNVRIWRIFLTPFKKVMISDVDLIILWVILVIPALIILGLWTLVSTPTADFEDREGEDHWVCTTGGFTGSPGGYVWFGILVAYQAVLIFFGLFLSVGTRNVPGLFNESRLIAISIYNIGFFGIVVIPIVIALSYINPFAGWIIRTAAILYGFTATLWLQFIPMIVGIVCIDRCGEYNQKMKIKGGDLLNQVRATNTMETNTATVGSD